MNLSVFQTVTLLRTLMMKKIIFPKFSCLILCILLIVLLSSCATVPVIGRKQLNIVPQGQLLSMSFSEYDKFLESNAVSRNHQETERVKRVGNRIQKAVKQYFQMNGMADRLHNYQWEFNLVEDEQANAWCMPGGKVVVNTGILPYTRDDAGLAVIMGHEIAHAVANHGNERMSQGILAQYGQVALAELTRSKPDETRALYMAAFGLGAQIGVMLPFSRLHEREADRLGLIFMAMAGYNPDRAIEFWARMTEQNNSRKPPEFLSTHPSDATRIRNIRAILPEARQYYQK